jgi:hypothetical protein
VSEQHIGLVNEDDPQTSAVVCGIVAALGHEPVAVATLEEKRAFYASGRRPCYEVQDLQVPYKHGLNAHESAGESGIRFTRGLSSGPFRIPVVVLTSFSKETRYVAKVMKLDADDYVMKSQMSELGGVLLQWLKETGREDHADCARCNERSRPASAPPEAKEAPIVARLLSNEGTRGIDEEELEGILARRKELDLFLNARDEERGGFLAGRRDLRGNYKETYIPKLHADILVELIEGRKAAIRATALKCFQGKTIRLEPDNAARLVQRARQAVDVHALVNGRESKRSWRAIHTTGEKNAPAFWFRPPGGMRWCVVGVSDSSP